MKGWQIVPLGQVIRQRKEFIEIDDLQTYKRARVQLHAKGIVLRDVVEGSMVKTKRQQVSRAGEFLVAEIDAKVGGFGIVPDDLDGAIVSSHYFLFEIDESKLERRFLDFFIRTPAFRDQVEAQGSTNYAAIRPAHVIAYQIPLPPLSEQRRIVARIEALAAEIAEAKRLRQEAVAEAEAMGKAWLNHRIESAAEQYGLERMGGAATSAAGFGFPKSYQGRADLDYPFVKVSDMNLPENARNITTAQNWIDKHDVEEMRVRIYPVGTVIFPKIGGAIATNKRRVLSVPATFDNNVMGLIPTDRLSSDFLFAVMQNFDLTQLQAGTSVPAISQGKVEEIQVAVPPLPEQRRIVAELDALQAQVDGLKRLQSETAAELDALLPAILDRAFKGEL
ncbi:MAG: restriction endonuclease subunit S [Verrucomicrobia bacterium]|nr:restriction endonuclease subunit S [Verrucomicrobiota bacterium]